MKKEISVSGKIKILGALLISTVFFVICVSLYLNLKNSKDATIINIAGKQRMLTQKITKNIFYLYQTKSNNFTQIDNAIEEFNYGLTTLKDGNELLNISAAPTDIISNQISKVIVLWNTFEKNTKEFKEAILKDDIQKQNSILKYMYETNTILLEEVDKVVSLYTRYIEEKTAFIKNFQYTSFALMFMLTIYSLVQLKQIESHAKEFMSKYNQLNSGEITNLEPIHVESEKEFVEMANNMNNFINKVNSAMNYSESALEQSKLASEKLLDLTDEFENIIDELGNKSEIVKEINRSEDIAIESSENLLKTTKKLNDLKTQLDLLLKNCQNK